MLRIASRQLRIAPLRSFQPMALGAKNFSTSFIRQSADSHEEETYEQYTQRYLKFFNEEADDLFELARGLNSAFCTDIVPAPEVLAAAMKAGRRLNSFPLAARVVEALREKLNGDQAAYDAYLKDLQPVMEELGVPAPEALGR